jgi:uncharacterized membrane protein YqaE (UPF0057 family)
MKEFNDIIKIVVALFFPPLGVALQIGLGIHFWINIFLTLFGYFPGLIHAFCIILMERD